MQIEGLSWFPGHMTKTKRMIVAEIRNMAVSYTHLTLPTTTSV